MLFVFSFRMTVTSCCLLRGVPVVAEEFLFNCARRRVNFTTFLSLLLIILLPPPGGGLLSWIRVRRCDYSRVTRVLSTSSDSSNEPAVFAHFWLRRGRMVLRPHLYCLTSRFTHVRSLYWGLGFFSARQGYGCIGFDRCDDYSADSSASLAQCCCCGDFRASLGSS